MCTAIKISLPFHKTWVYENQCLSFSSLLNSQGRISFCFTSLRLAQWILANLSGHKWFIIYPIKYFQVLCKLHALSAIIPEKTFLPIYSSSLSFTFIIFKFIKFITDENWTKPNEHFLSITFQHHFTWLSIKTGSILSVHLSLE